MSERFAVFAAPRALTIRAGHRMVGIDAFSAAAGDALAIVPPRGVLGTDLAVALARVLTTLRAPASGTVELMGHDPTTLSYLELLRLRTRLGFVPGQGGLLSNRSLRENLALPISVHLRRDEAEKVAELVERFDLGGVADLRPHEVDGATRFRACAARALVLSPPWLVVEGAGDFDSEEGPSLTWRELFAYRGQGDAAVAVCLPRPMPAFERWISSQGGAIARYRLLSEAPPAGDGRRT